MAPGDDNLIFRKKSAKINNILGINNSIWDQYGVVISNENNDQVNISLDLNVEGDRIFVAWEDFRNGTDFDIYCSAIDGATLSVTSDIELCTYSGNQKTPNAYATLDGSYIFSWEDSRGSVTSNIYFQLMQNNIFIYNQDGIVLCDADFNQLTPKTDLYNEATNSYMVFWDDMRSSGKEDLSNIYVQSVTVLSDDVECTILDVNDDGIINVIDIVQTVNLILDTTPPTPWESCAADGNQDGIINILDVVTLVNIVLGLGN